MSKNNKVRKLNNNKRGICCGLAATSGQALQLQCSLEFFNFDFDVYRYFGKALTNLEIMLLKILKASIPIRWRDRV